MVINTYLYGVGGKAIVDAAIKAGLTLRYEVNARSSCSRVRNEAGDDGGLPHLLLLAALPAVRMREYKLDSVSRRIPQALPVAVCLRDITAGAIKEIAEKVGEDGYNALPGRQWREPILRDCASIQALWAEVELEPT